MPAVFLDERLRERGYSIEPIRALTPDANLYSALLLQLSGDIEATRGFIRSRDRAEINSKLASFLDVAQVTDADLAMTPEYSCPWAVLAETIRLRRLPAAGKVWVLGCESISPAEFTTFVNSHTDIEWVFQTPLPTGQGQFLDPVCFIFVASNVQRQHRHAIAVQFKTQAMADREAHFERDHLILGDERYILRNGDNSINLACLICSEALTAGLDALPAGQVHPYLILHPQLNADPRHVAIRHYRHDSYLNNRQHREIICLNWSRGVSIVGSPSAFGGSAIYTNSQAINLGPERLNSNHRKGLYYTRMDETRSHAFLLAFHPERF